MRESDREAGSENAPGHELPRWAAPADPFDSGGSGWDVVNHTGWQPLAEKPNIVAGWEVVSQEKALPVVTPMQNAERLLRRHLPVVAGTTAYVVIGALLALALFMLLGMLAE